MAEQQSLWLVLHTHRHGTSTFMVRHSAQPEQEPVVAALGIDYEPDREECIEIFLVDSDACPTLDELETAIAAHCAQAGEAA
jgi:hypothetical protein